MPTDPTPEHHRAIELHGRDVTIKQFSFGSANSYGDKPRNQDSSSTIRAVVDRTGGATVDRGPAGVDRQRTISITVKDSETVNETPPETRFDIDGHTYQVVTVDDRSNGTIDATLERINDD